MSLSFFVVGAPPALECDRGDAVSLDAFHGCQLLLDLCEGVVAIDRQRDILHGILHIDDDVDDVGLKQKQQQCLELESKETKQKQNTKHNNVLLLLVLGGLDGLPPCLNGNNCCDL